MQETILYIAVTVIIGALLFVLLSVQEHAADASVDSVEYVAMQGGVLDLAQILERDLNNIGSQVAGTPFDPDTAIIAFDTISSPRHFDFYAMTVRGQPANRVRYEWTLTDSVTLSRGVVPIFEVTRRVNGTVDGQSIPLSMMDIRLLRADSTGIFNLRDTRQIHVRLRGVSSLSTKANVEEASWEKIIRPVNMGRQDRAW
jgi:hypothetical protein